MHKKILYIANTPAPSDLDDYRKRAMIAVNASNYNVQVMRGFVQNGHEVHTLFVDTQLSTSRHFQELGIHFHYLTGYLNIPKQLKKLNMDSKSTLVLCDTLHLRGILLSLSFIKLNQLKMIGIVTDLYRFFHKKGSFNLKSYLFMKLGEWTLHQYDAYVLVSELIKQEAFTKNKPILVAEGIFDLPDLPKSFNKENIILYSGALEAEHGILNVMDAVNELVDFPYVFHIYSASPRYKEFDDRLSHKVIFKGYLDRNNLLIKQRQAKILINPRPLNLPFNAYSFPSKLIEYMASGTPTITSALPSIPERFIQGLYLIEDISLNGLKTALNAFCETPYTVHQVKADNLKIQIEDEFAHTIVAKKIEQLIQ